MNMLTVYWAKTKINTHVCHPLFKTYTYIIFPSCKENRTTKKIGSSALCSDLIFFFTFVSSKLVRKKTATSCLIGFVHVSIRRNAEKRKKRWGKWEGLVSSSSHLVHEWKALHGLFSVTKGATVFASTPAEQWRREKGLEVSDSEKREFNATTILA